MSTETTKLLDSDFMDWRLRHSADTALAIAKQLRSVADTVERETHRHIQNDTMFHIPGDIIHIINNLHAGLRTDILVSQLTDITQCAYIDLKKEEEIA